MIASQRGHAHHEEVSVHDQVGVFRQSQEEVVGSGYLVLLLLELEDLRENRAGEYTNSGGTWGYERGRKGKLRICGRIA